MKKINFTIFVVLLCMSLNSFSKDQKAKANPPLVMVIGENMSEPYLIKSPKLPQEYPGIQPEYMRALAHHLKREANILVLPKFRIIKYIEQEEIDMNCYTTPQWAKVGNTKIRWSEPLFTLRDMIVGREDLSGKKVEDLFGSTIGATLYYRYLSLEKYFAEKKLIREDANTEENNFSKLEAKRLPYIIVPEIPLFYYLKGNKKSSISPKGIVIEETPIRCWIRDGVNISTEELNKAINEMKKSGEIDRIFKKYR